MAAGLAAVNSRLRHEPERLPACCERDRIRSGTVCHRTLNGRGFFEVGRVEPVRQHPDNAVHPEFWMQDQSNAAKDRRRKLEEGIPLSRGNLVMFLETYPRAVSVT